MERFNLPDKIEQEGSSCLKELGKGFLWWAIACVGVYKCTSHFWDAAEHSGKFDAYSEVKDEVGEEIECCNKVIDILSTKK